jgi:hypothetical protein
MDIKNINKHIPLVWRRCTDDDIFGVEISALLQVRADFLYVTLAMRALAAFRFCGLVRLSRLLISVAELGADRPELRSAVRSGPTPTRIKCGEP